ncbi:hypothetical protein N9L31_00260 [bacterium]|nr:hypothetical protein [bacterium]
MVHIGDVLGALYESSKKESQELERRVYDSFCADHLEPKMHKDLDVRVIVAICEAVMPP